MSNYIKWNGEAEDTRNAEDQHNESTWFGNGDVEPSIFKWNWGEVPFTWNDVQLLIEAIAFGGHVNINGKPISSLEGLDIHYDLKTEDNNNSI